MGLPAWLERSTCDSIRAMYPYQRPGWTSSHFTANRTFDTATVMAYDCLYEVRAEPPMSPFSPDSIVMHAKAAVRASMLKGGSPRASIVRLVRKPRLNYGTSERHSQWKRQSLARKAKICIAFQHPEQ